MHSAQTAEDIQIRFLCIQQSHVSPRSCYNSAYIGHPYLHKFCPKVSQPLVYLRHSMANCDRMIRDSAMTDTASSLIGTVLHHRTLRSRRFNSSAVFTTVSCSWHTVRPAHSSGTRQARVRRRRPSCLEQSP